MGGSEGPHCLSDADDRAIVAAWLPDLNNSEWSVESDDDRSYNCFAWAAGETNRKWSPQPHVGSTGSGIYWPAGIPSLPTVDAVIGAYRTCGYEICESPDLEEGVEKVAIFGQPPTRKGDPCHAARQLPSGWWASKLGVFVDIEHAELHAVSGVVYGQVVVVMQRPRRSEPPEPPGRRRIIKL